MRYHIPLRLYLALHAHLLDLLVLAYQDHPYHLLVLEFLVVQQALCRHVHLELLGQQCIMYLLLPLRSLNIFSFLRHLGNPCFGPWKNHFFTLNIFLPILIIGGRLSFFAVIFTIGIIDLVLHRLIHIWFQLLESIRCLNSDHYRLQLLPVSQIVALQQLSDI